MTIAELRARVTASTIPRIEMSVTDIASLLDVAEAAERATSSMTHYAGSSNGLACAVGCRPCALINAIARLETP